MKVMRENKESLLAIMEAFVYDPLISFRLLNPKMFKKHQDEMDVSKEKAPGLEVNKAPTQQPVI